MTLMTGIYHLTQKNWNDYCHINMLALVCWVGLLILITLLHNKNGSSEEICCIRGLREELGFVLLLYFEL